MAIFVLAGFVFFLIFGSAGKKDLSFHLLFFALACLTKESGLIIPLIAFLYFYLIRKEKITQKQKGLLLGWLGVLIFYFLLRSLGLKNPIKYGLAEMIVSAFKNSPALIQFLGKIFFPFNLTVLPTITDTTPCGVIAILILTLMIILAKTSVGALLSSA